MISHNVVIQGEPHVIPLIDVLCKCRLEVAAISVVLALELEAKLVYQKEHLHHT